MPNRIQSALLASFLSVFSVASLPAQEDAELNLSMDRVVDGEELPQGWDKIGTYSVTTENDPDHKSNSFVRIESGRRTGIGVVRYFLPTESAGEEVVLTGKIKVENVARRGGARLRIVFFRNGRIISNKDSQPIIGTTGWKDYTISLAAPERADRFAVVGFLNGTGTAWFDDFRLSESPDSPSPLAEKDNEFDAGSGITRIPTDKATVAALELLGRVWGYVKYHHPTVASGQLNWDYELFRFLPKYLAERSVEKRHELIVAWVEELGEFKTSDRQASKEDGQYEYKLQPDTRWLESIQSNRLRSLLKSIQTAKRPLDQHYVGSHSAGNPKFNEEPYAQFQHPDAGFRLLALFRYWNIVQYYYPYRSLTDKDWNIVLGEFIPKFVNAKDVLEYNLAAAELIGAVQDTHAQIYPPNEVMAKHRGKKQGALQLRFIEGSLVVTGFADDDLVDQQAIQVGDIVARVGGIAVEKWVAENGNYPASNRAAQLRIIADNILRTNEDDVTIGLRRGRKTFSVTLPALDRGQVRKGIQQRNSPSSWKVLGNIGYLYPGILTATDVRRLPRQLAKTNGLVVDLRCYPSQFIVFSVGGLLMPEATEFVRFTQPDPATPGAFFFGEPLKVGRRNWRYFKGRVAILVDERTQSQAEYTAMALRVAPHAKVFGSTTAGADGNISGIVLPGNIRTGISGLGVYTPEGNDTQRVGIIPDVKIEPTLAGIRSGKDEVLESALVWVRNSDDQP